MFGSLFGFGSSNLLSVKKNACGKKFVKNRSDEKKVLIKNALYKITKNENQTKPAQQIELRGHLN